MMTLSKNTTIIEGEAKGKEYIIKKDFGYEYPPKSAEFMFRDGNYACDCNKSIFIKDQCDKKFRQRICGEKINLVDIKIRQVK